MNLSECPNYNKTEGYIHCNSYEQLGLNCNCMQNRLCPFRESNYRKHPEKYIQFGKYKYKEYKDIPKNYLAWCLMNIKTNKTYIENYIISTYKDDMIQRFVELNATPTRHIRHIQRCYSEQRIPVDLDYGGELFDAMQGCI